MQAHDAPSLVNFTLPYPEVPRFGPLLTTLDAERSSLQVQDYTLAMTSLDEVFMELGRQAEEQASAESGGQTTNVDFQTVTVDEAGGGENICNETSSKRSMIALYTARLLPLRKDRQKRMYLCFLPAFSVCGGFFVSSQGGDQQAAQSNSYAVIIYPAMAFSLALISLCMEVMQDKSNKCKYVAISQGLTPRDYWIGTAAAHFTIQIPTVVMFILMLFVLRPASIGIGSVPMLIMMVILYPVNTLLFSYTVTQAFKTPEVALKVLPIVSMLGTMLPPMIVYGFVTIGSFYSDIALGLHIVLSCILPTYNLPGMLAYLVSQYSLEDLSVVDSFMSIAALPLYLFPIASIIYLRLLVRLDSRSYSSQPGACTEQSDERKDADVLAEEQRCLREDGRDEAARYQGLNHTYRSKVAGKWKETTAVRGISLGIQKGECFGLLGPNGCGKTTTLDVLTGEIRPPSSGHVSIFGHDMSQQEGFAQAYKVLGVCPQVDPLWESLSGRNHLLYYGRLKGVPEATLASTVNLLLQRLGLEVFDADKPAKEYSGGMKRKLSLGIALIGHSPMLFLDEPSAGVDAGAKRHLWKVIKLRGPDQTVVLTTHSLEEAEALCNRMAIQVKGQLRCLGTSMHIKRKYGSGYQLEILTKPGVQEQLASGSDRPAPARAEGNERTQASGPPEAIMRFVREKISPDAEVLESHADRHLFQMPPMSAGSGLSLGHMFTELQQNIRALNIADYTITQPSLEQVFLRFAREQADEGDDGTPASPVGSYTVPV